MLARSQLRQLVSLLDDPDPQVSTPVKEYLHACGEEVLEGLEALLPELSRAESAVVCSELQLLRFDFKCQDLARWAAVPQQNDLLQGLLMADSLINPLEVPIDGPTVRCAYEDQYATALVELEGNRTLMEQVELLNHVIYRQLNYLPQDPFLKDITVAIGSQSLLTHKANPICMGMIYMMLAYACGVDLQCALFKGGFAPVVRDASGKPVFFLNVYKKGELIPFEQLEQLLKETPIKDHTITVTSCYAVDLLAMYLETLLFLYASKEDKEREKIVDHLLEVLGRDRQLIMEIDEDT